MTLQETPSQRRATEDWQVLRRWRDETSGFAVELKQDRSVPWPKCTVQVGRARDDSERLRPYIPIIVDTADDGSVAIRHSTEFIDDALQEAEEMCLRMRRTYNEANQARKAAREANRADQQGTHKPRKGKTERDRARKRATATE